MSSEHARQRGGVQTEASDDEPRVAGDSHPAPIEDSLERMYKSTYIRTKMSPQIHSLFAKIGAVGILILAVFILANPDTAVRVSPEIPLASSTAQTAGASAATAETVATSSEEAVVPKVAAPAKPAATPAAQKKEPEPETNEVERIQDPYAFPAKPFSVVNEEARSALVNILCAPSGGNLRPISGSGVIIDPRGVILTNAHVAQYVLLSQSTAIDISCTVRYGAPARALWTAEILYMSSAWVNAHAHEIIVEKPTGTGEHDYALLLINGSRGAPLPATFPFIPVDVREGIAFLGDHVLAASYPAEFIGGIAAQYDLYPASSVTTIRDLLTFDAGTIDLVSIGGIIEAQSGSSGGAVVNAWGRLVGVITTTSEGATTAERDLRAITLSYINRDIASLSGFDLATILGGSVAAQAAEFRSDTAPHLIRTFIDVLTKRSR